MYIVSWKRQHFNFRPLTYLIVFTIVIKEKSYVSCNSYKNVHFYLNDKNYFAAISVCIVMELISLRIHNAIEFLLANSEWRYKREWPKTDLKYMYVSHRIEVRDFGTKICNVNIKMNFSNTKYNQTSYLKVFILFKGTPDSCLFRL